MFDVLDGSPVGYGLREWVLTRDGQVIAGSTNNIDGERFGQRVTVVGSSR